MTAESTRSWMDCRNPLHPLEQRLIDRAIRIFPVEITLYRVGPYRTSSMADPQIATINAVLTLNQHFRSFPELLAGLTLPDDGGKAVTSENISEAKIRIACLPAVARGDMSLRINADELIGTVGLPDA